MSTTVVPEPDVVVTYEYRVTPFVTTDYATGKQAEISYVAVTVMLPEDPADDLDASVSHASGFLLKQDGTRVVNSPHARRIIGNGGRVPEVTVLLEDAVRRAERVLR